MFRSLDHPQGAYIVPCLSYVCIGVGLYVVSLAGKSVGRLTSLQQIQHTHDMPLHHRNM